MRKFSSCLKSVVLCLGFSLSVAAIAADGPGAEVKVRVGKQTLALKVATGNPDTVSAHAQGPVLKADVTLQSQSGDCLDVVSALYPGVCVPVGPGLPVSPN